MCQKVWSLEVLKNGLKVGKLTVFSVVHVNMDIQFLLISGIFYHISGAPEFFLSLCLGVTPVGAQGKFCGLGIEPVLIVCKANALTSVFSVWPLNEDIN